MSIYYETWNNENQELELTTDPNKSVSDRMIIGISDRLDWEIEHNKSPFGDLDFSKCTD